MRVLLRSPLLALLLAPSLLAAQTPIGWSVHMGPAWSTFAGGPASSSGGGGSIGLAKEYPLREASTYRLEFLTVTSSGGVGEIGDLMPAPATLSAQRFVVGAGVRRYTAGRAFVGVGATLGLATVCFVDLESGASFYGQTLECREVTDYRIAPAGATLGTALTAGINRGNWDFELRYDQGLAPVARTDRGDLVASNVGAMLHYRFGREARTGAPNIQKPRANPPLPGQVMAGALGWGAGFLAGLVVGSVISENPGEDWTPLLTGVFGTFIGTPIGVHMYGARHGTRANPLPTIAGTFLGAFGGPAAPYTMPLGAVIGYNTTSRER